MACGEDTTCGHPLSDCPLPPPTTHDDAQPVRALDLVHQQLVELVHDPAAHDDLGLARDGLGEGGDRCVDQGPVSVPRGEDGAPRERLRAGTPPPRFRARPRHRWETHRSPHPSHRGDRRRSGGGGRCRSPAPVSREPPPGSFTMRRFFLRSLAGVTRVLALRGPVASHTPQNSPSPSYTGWSSLTRLPRRTL